MKIEKRVKGTLRGIAMMATPLNGNVKEQSKCIELILKNPELEDDFQRLISEEWIERARAIDKVYISLGRNKEKGKKPKLKVEFYGKYKLPLIYIAY